VNCPLEVSGKPISPQAVARLFNRPTMGGLERKGVLATGTKDQVRQAAENVLKIAPDRFILAADCTVPSETSWIISRRRLIPPMRIGNEPSLTPPSRKRRGKTGASQSSRVRDLRLSIRGL